MFPSGVPQVPTSVRQHWRTRFVFPGVQARSKRACLWARESGSGSGARRRLRCRVHAGGVAWVDRDGLSLWLGDSDSARPGVVHASNSSITGTSWPQTNAPASSRRAVRPDAEVETYICVASYTPRSQRGTRDSLCPKAAAHSLIPPRSRPIRRGFHCCRRNRERFRIVEDVWMLVACWNSHRSRQSERRGWLAPSAACWAVAGQ